ncbi:receptor-like protein kinase [Gossypium australe]|uniref:Receptor-like protein kinase n=1 Tax=Gossypium australe TaxID=47621 RepID=A0A5B6WSF2_9ROSI|nr:receptor-like protein kinase [Gossypium australe]
MIPERKWDRDTMDFVLGLPLFPKKKDPFWVVTDRLMKYAHFTPVRTDYSLDKLAELQAESAVHLAYEIVERIGPMAYRLALPAELEKIHNVFHASMLRRYRLDSSHVISPAKIKIQPDMTYNEELIKILAQEVKQLRNKSIALVKVLWRQHDVEEATWEPEEAMRK